MKFRSWEWSFARVFCENQTAKVKFCQFNLWMFYCTSVVLSGKLFRIKPCLWLKPISVNLLCKFKSSQLVYSLQPLKVLPSSADHLGMPYKRWAMLLFMPPCPSHTWWESLASSQHACTSWCAPVPARHVDYIPLQSAWVEPSLAAAIKNNLGPSPDQPLVTELTFNWKQQHSKF